jgi:hypothetical protein|tara:strand:- start:338 stop:703 length:366 start_codon:yes stop_codon:yes gene_type:complete
MASIFCPECGARAAYTLNKPKFCQTCGEKFEMGSAVASEDNEEEGLEVVPELRKLDYSIEMDHGKTTLGNLFDNPMAPANESSSPASIKGHKTQTKKQLLSQSLAECASRRQPSISEDGAE